MKPGGNTVLCALLAVLVLGMGVQTYHLIQLERALVPPGATGDAAFYPAAGAAPPGPPAIVGTPAPDLLDDPFDPIADVEARVESLFDAWTERLERFERDPWSPFSEDHEPWAGAFVGPRLPTTELEDRGDHYELRLDAPGADEASIDVRTEDRALVIEGTGAATKEETGPDRTVLRERRSSRFERRVPLPTDADPTRLVTDYADGVFRVRIDKRG